MSELTYTEKFTQLVTELEDTIRKRKKDERIRFAYKGTGYDVADRSQRMVLVGRIAEDYVMESGRTDGALFERLTDAILDEEITDPNPHKVAHEEYPFFSTRQLDLRRDRETGLKAAEETGTDGRDYRVPKRRRRTGYENGLIDKQARIRNAERAAQYKRDTAPGDVITYYLSDSGSNSAAVTSK